MIRVIATLFTACLLWTAMPSAGQAQGSFGCACIHNQTGQSVSFRYKWGNDDWRNHQVAPSANHALCWNYAGGPHVSPPLLFQLDRDMGPGKAWTTYTINRAQTQVNSCAFVPAGVHYNIDFQPGTNNQYIHVTRRAAGTPVVSGPRPAPVAFGCGCINNMIGQPVNFRWRLGNQPWQTATLLPGNVYSFCTPFGAGPQSWEWLHFQLDRDMGPGAAWTDYTIARVGSMTNQCSGVPRPGQYFVRFQPGTNGQFIHVTK